MERARSEREPRWFGPALTLVVVAALALRVAYVFIYRRNFDPGGDAFFYHAGAGLQPQLVNRKNRAVFNRR